MNHIDFHRSTPNSIIIFLKYTLLAWVMYFIGLAIFGFANYTPYMVANELKPKFILLFLVFGLSVIPIVGLKNEKTNRLAGVIGFFCGLFIFSAMVYYLWPILF